MVDHAPSTDPECPRCGQTFQHKRKNQRYCSRPCQKATTQNTMRGSQKIADNSTAKRMSEVQRHRACLLNFELYSKRPADRPAFMEAILSAARIHDRHLHRILSDHRPYLEFETDDWGRPNLTRTLDDYCKRTRNGARLWQVIALIGMMTQSQSALLSYIGISGRTRRVDQTGRDPRMSKETPLSSFGKFGQSQSQRSRGKPIRPLVL